MPADGISGASCGRTSLISLIVVAGVSVGFASCGGAESPIEPTPVCSFAISPAAGGFASDGGAATVTVTVAAGCAWNATSNVEWIVVTAGTTGSGPGTVAYSVNANSSTQPRSGVVTIGGQGHAVTQQGRSPVVCAYALDPDNSSFGNDGGARTFTVNAPAECGWTAVSDASWLIVTTGGQGTGNGTVSYTVAANGDTNERVAQIAVADRRFTVRQGGNFAACRYSVGPVEFSPCMPAGSVTATLTTQTSCPWTAVPDTSWLSVPSGTSGTGFASSRSRTRTTTMHLDRGMVMVRWPTPTAGQNIRVAQARLRYAVSRAAFNMVAAGGSFTFDVIQQSDPYTCGGATQDRCMWTAQSNVPWITITSSMPRAGDNPVAFVVASNDASVTRVGTITVRDKAVVITQTGR